MASPREIVVEINAYLGSRATPTRTLADLAAVYATFCQEANARLRRCADYLGRGLRAEALYHAEVEPGLLDLVAALDLPRLEEWDAVCQTMNLERPQPLLLDVAGELNQAYSTHQTADALLKRLRLLSLARAPLRDRLAVLRRLAQVDPANALLEKDVAAYEAARIREIVVEAETAFHAGNLAQLTRLVQELEDGAWRTAVPPGALSEVRGRARAIQTEEAFKHLRRLLPRLHAAHMAQSYAECASLLTEWNRTVTENELKVPAALEQEVGPVAAWLAETEAQEAVARGHASATAGLETAVAQVTSIPHLQRLYAQVAAYDQPIPQDLIRRYEGWIERLELGHRRRRRAILAAAVAGVVAIAGGVTWVVRDNMARARAIEFSLQLGKAIQDYHVDEADRLVENTRVNEPAILERRLVREALERLAKAKDQLEKERETFGSCIAQANDELAQVPDLGDTLDEAVLLAARGHLNTALGLVKSVEGFRAVPPARGRDLDALKARCERDLLRVQGKLDDLAITVLNGLIDEYAKVNKGLMKSPLDFLRQTDSFRDRLAALTTRPVGESVKVAVEYQQQAVAADRSAAARNQTAIDKRNDEVRRQAAAIDALPHRARTAVGLAAALKQFAADHPSAPPGPGLPPGRPR